MTPRSSRELLERETDNGADGLLLIPADRDVLAQTVEDVTNAIPVVTMETDMSEDGAAACVSVDNTALGRMLGEIAINGAPEGSSVLLLSGVPDATGISDRMDAAAEGSGGGGAPGLPLYAAQRGKSGVCAGG